MLRAFIHRTGSRGAAPPGRRRRLLTRKDVRGRVPAPGRKGAAAGVPRKARLAAAVITAPAGRHTVAGTGGALTRRHGRAAAGVRSSGPRDTTATPRGLRAKLPPLPPPSPRSASAAPRRSLRAITYRAVRGRRARGRGARPEPSNRLTRECRSQSRGRLRAAPTGLQRAASFCLRRSPRSAPHPRTGPAPSRTSLPIGLLRPRPKSHAPMERPRPRSREWVPGHALASPGSWKPLVAGVGEGHPSQLLKTKPRSGQAGEPVRPQQATSQLPRIFFEQKSRGI